MNDYDKIKPILDRMFAKTASADDYIIYLRFELQESMKALPPDAPDNKSDGYHAGCCALRALAATYQLERLLHRHDCPQKSRQPIEDYPKSAEAPAGGKQ